MIIYNYIQLYTIIYNYISVGSDMSRAGMEVWPDISRELAGDIGDLHRSCVFTSSVYHYYITRTASKLRV